MTVTGQRCRVTRAGEVDRGRGRGVLQGELRAAGGAAAQTPQMNFSAGGAWWQRAGPLRSYCVCACTFGQLRRQLSQLPPWPPEPSGRAGGSWPGGEQRAGPGTACSEFQSSTGTAQELGQERAGEAQTDGEGREGEDGGQRQGGGAVSRGMDGSTPRERLFPHWLPGLGARLRGMAPSCGQRQPSACMCGCGTVRAGEQGAWPRGSAHLPSTGPPSSPPHRPTATRSCHPGLPSGNPCHHPKSSSPGPCLNTLLPQRPLGLPNIGS